MPSSPDFDRANLFVHATPTTEYVAPPPRTFLHPERNVLARRRSQIARITAIGLTISLVGLSAGIWLSPQVHRWGSGPTPDQVALQREQARGEDLKRQVAELSNELAEPHPATTDQVAAARADDLKRQVEELEDKLGIPRPPVTDGVQAARAADLQERLRAAEQRLKVPRPPVTDGVQAARAAALAAENDRLEADLTRPRPTIDPLATVTATMTKADLLGARSQFGLYTTQSPFNFAEVDLVQGLVARKANIIGYFQSFNDPFNEFPIRNTWLRGQVPLMTWESQDQVGSITADVPKFTMSKIINGEFDEYIRSYARGIANLRLPLIIRFDHEMNGTWYPWSEWLDSKNESINGNSRGDYVKMWRHVHDIFAAESANDYVIWLWSPNRLNRVCQQRKPWEYYPGDDYVDWVGMSGYFRDYQSLAGPCDDVSPTFAGVFGATLPELQPPSLAQASGGGAAKPILLSEIGATEDGGHKPDWITALFGGLADHPDIIGFVWFSLAVSSGGESRNTHDWRIDSSAPAQQAMAEGLAASGLGIAPGH